MKRLFTILILIFTLSLTTFNFIGCSGKEPPHTHKYTQLKTSSTQHWYECSCGEINGIENHKGGNATCKNKAECSVCGEGYGSYSGHVYEQGKCIWCEGNSTEIPPSDIYTVDPENENIIYFGKYPQTIKDESVTLSSTANANGYFVGSDGEEYAKVIADPWKDSYKFSNNKTVTEGNEYYFKVEPIRWTILSTDGETATILCDSIISNKRYDDFDNNYEESEIRAWLNNEFYNTAFNNYEQAIIKTALIDNSEQSTGYSDNQFACENTNDKVYLLSYLEAKTIKGNNKDTKMQTSDYARATGVWINTDTSAYGNSCWWLRSPSCFSVDNANLVYDDGSVSIFSIVNNTSYGVVPTLTIKL